MNISAIRTRKDYQRAMARIEEIFDASPSTPEGEELEILSVLAEAYENEHFPIEAPDAVEFLKNVMEFRGLQQKDLAVILHSRSRATELLSKKRPLSLTHIRKISAAWSIPVGPLIKEYELQV